MPLPGNRVRGWHRSNVAVVRQGVGWPAPPTVIHRYGYSLPCGRGSPGRERQHHQRSTGEPATAPGVGVCWKCGLPGAEFGGQFLPPTVAVFVFGVGAGAEGEDLVVDAVGETVEQDTGRALKPAFGFSCRWGRAEDGGEPRGQEQAAADGIGQFAAQSQSEALFRALAGGDGRLFVGGGRPVRLSPANSRERLTARCGRGDIRTPRNDGRRRPQNPGLPRRSSGKS